MDDSLKKLLEEYEIDLDDVEPIDISIFVSDFLEMPNGVVSPTFGIDK